MKINSILLVGLLNAFIIDLNAQCSNKPIKEAVRNGDFEAGYLTGSGASHTFTTGSAFDFQSDLNFAGNYSIASPCNTTMGNRYAVARNEDKPACGGRNAQFGNGYVLPGAFKDHTPGKAGDGFALLADFEAFSGTGTSGSGKPAAWKQLVDIIPNQKYYFSAWFANYNRDANSGLYNNPDLNFVVVPVNGSGTLVTSERVVVGIATSTGVMQWQQFYGEWIPLNNYSRAYIYIEVEQATGTNMNDLAIDDISFINGCQNINSLPASLIPNLGAEKNICLTNGSVTLNSNVATGGTTQFWWYKDSGTPTVEYVTASSTVANYTVSDTGTYRVCIQNASFPGSCSASSTVKVVNQLPNVVLNDQTICASTDVLLDAGVSGPTLSYNWTVPSGVSNPGNVKTFSTSVTGNYSVTVSSTIPSCASKSDGAVVTTNLATPTLTGANCAASPRTFNLTASGGSGTSYAWWSAPTGGTQVGTGTPFTMSVAAASLPYTLYLENFSTISAGLPIAQANTSTGGDASRAENTFSTTSDITLSSVQFRPDNCGGSIQIKLQQNGVDVVGASTTLACNQGVWTTANLNFNIPTGSNYKLVAVTGSWLSISGSFSSTTYGPVTLTGNVFGSGGFFDWQIKQGAPCIRSSVILTCPAPVEFSFVNVQNIAENKNSLRWGTSFEKNNKIFEIEKSLDGISFYKIGEVQPVSNSTSAVSYNYTDYDEFNTHVYYRIKQEDFDGSYSYSKIVSISSTKEKNWVVYPNPAKDFIKIESNLAAEANIYNGLGKIVGTFKIEEGVNQLLLADLTAGFYNLRIQNLDKVEDYKLIIK